MTQSAIANTSWEDVDRLDKPARARVHKAMAQFQRLTVPQADGRARWTLFTQRNANRMTRQALAATTLAA
ncbi:hypothetical protein ABZ173_18375 [Streptomyces rochei]|uniref:hypothetical protein n=1 Tax=Streptomyces sp. V17-9 TaxID=2831149 RepID=UPI0018754555|nr:hypothetical protein KE639_05699 [Streptomyces sp. V17-9]GGZ46685.1 hypothetical protein GCM10010301_18890 [Streptomyces plicatus]GHC03216.1 hypothetical protein GCM10010308_14620 [Streptomyces vinaceusdrappus]